MRLLLTTTLLLLTLTAQPALAQYPGQENALYGMRGVKVLIWDINDELKDMELSSDTLQTDIELHLRKAGVPVLPGKEWPTNYQKAVVVATVLNVTDKDTVLNAVTIKLELWRIVDFNKDAPPLYMSTWEKLSVGLVGKQRLRSSVRETLADAADAFANDYLAANPKR